MKIFYVLLMGAFCLFFASTTSGTAGALPVQINDASGRDIVFSRAPERVVCLSPYITQMLVDLGQDDRIVALTRQDLVLHAHLRKSNAGSYFNPDISIIKKCAPDLVICPPGKVDRLQEELNSQVRVLAMDARSMDQFFDQIRQMGRLFECEAKAAETLARMQTQLSMVIRRLALEKDLKKKRVVRVMAGDSISCPGDDSFQNEMIQAAGGIVPHWGKSGFAVKVDPESWQRFNPQVIYGCGENADKILRLLNTEAYRNVEAVKKGSIHMFPCEMTCRVSTTTGDFVQWLAAVLYPDIFADPDRAVTSDKQLDQRRVSLKLDYVDTARVINHRLADAQYKSLVIRFKTPQTVLSTFEGLRENIDGCGNTFVPYAASLGHMRNGVDGVGLVKQTLESNLGFSKGRFATLMTGADMDNLAVVEKKHKDLMVIALVTAGVRGNAMRLSKDKGYYSSHGTINIIVGANRKLSTAVMSRAVITVTEAKTAALTDLDIRSSYTPWRNRATGTGTDNVLVIQGQGPWIEYAGGHSKLAQLMAEAVHEGVTRALAGQDGILAGRDVFQRLAERGLSLESLIRQFEIKMDLRPLTAKLENLLAQPYYAAFIESALAVADAQDKDLIVDSSFWNETCEKITFKICGKKATLVACGSNTIPTPLARALGAIISGIESSEDTHP